MRGAPTKADEEAAHAQIAALGIYETREWGDWKAGEVVGVTHQAGEFLILSFRVDPATGNCKWVNVVGGANGAKECRSFLPSKLTRKPLKRGRKDGED